MRNLGSPAPASSASAAGSRRSARTPVADADKVDILRDYLRRWKMEVGVFFDGVGPDATDDELAAIAPGHPVFLDQLGADPEARSWRDACGRWRAGGRSRNRKYANELLAAHVDRGLVVTLAEVRGMADPPALGPLGEAHLGDERPASRSARRAAAPCRRTGSSVVASGASSPANRSSSASVNPVPTRPAYRNAPSS